MAQHVDLDWAAVMCHGGSAVSRAFFRLSPMYFFGGALSWDQVLGCKESSNRSCTSNED